MKNIAKVWSEISGWLEQNLPEVITDLNPPASEEQLQQFEINFGLALPEDCKTLYRMHNGQRGQYRGAFFGMEFMPLERILVATGNPKRNGVAYPKNAELEPNDLAETWRSVPELAIRPMWVSGRWIPFAELGADMLGIDFDPGSAGSEGQIINYGRYATTKVVLAKDFAGYLSWVATELALGKGRVYESAGLKLFTHADLIDGDVIEAMVKLFGTTDHTQV